MITVKLYSQQFTVNVNIIVFKISKYFLVNIMSYMTTVKLYSQQFTVNVNISFKYQNTSE